MNKNQKDLTWEEKLEMLDKFKRENGMIGKAKAELARMAALGYI